jgi:hypothetical protein
MINIPKLHEIVSKATPGNWSWWQYDEDMCAYFLSVDDCTSPIDYSANENFLNAFNPTLVTELLDRLELGELALKENPRLAKEHQEAHDWNNKLVSEHYDLKAENARLRTESETRLNESVKFRQQAVEQEVVIMKLREQLKKSKTAFRNILYVDARPDLSLHKFHDALDIIHKYATEASKEIE